MRRLTLAKRKRSPEKKAIAPYVLPRWEERPRRGDAVGGIKRPRLVGEGIIDV